MVPPSGRRPSSSSTIQKSVQRLTQLTEDKITTNRGTTTTLTPSLDSRGGDISRLLSFSAEEGGGGIGGGEDTPERHPPSQELNELNEYMKNHNQHHQSIAHYMTPRPYDEQRSLSRMPPQSSSSRGVFRDRSNVLPPTTTRRKDQPWGTNGTEPKTKARDPTPTKLQPSASRPSLSSSSPSLFVQRQYSLDDLAGLRLVPSPSPMVTSRINQSSLIVELSQDDDDGNEQQLEEEEEEENDEEVLASTSTAYYSHRDFQESPLRSMTIIPLEPDEAQSPVHEPSILLGGGNQDDERVAVYPLDDGPQSQQQRQQRITEDHYFLFPPQEENHAKTAAGTTAQSTTRLSLHLPPTPATVLLDSQLHELELKRPKTPEDARQWLKTAVVALQEARSERESARQWARDMKTAVEKWTVEQQRLVQLEASSHLCDTLQRLEGMIVDLTSKVHSRHEQQDSSQSHLYELVHQQQVTLQGLLDDVRRQSLTGKQEMERATKPSIPSTATTLRKSPPGKVTVPPHRQSMDASTCSSRVQRFLPNGTGRLIVYSSGVEKEVHNDGTVVIRFPNGDIETKLPDKKVAYYHAAENVMQITQPQDQSILLEYPNGQMECHYADGSKVVVFPNGQKVKLDSKGKIISRRSP